MPSKEALVIIAASESDANLYYATRFLVPDPVIFFQIGSKKHLVLSDLEIDRAKETACVHHIHSSSQIGRQLTNNERTRGLPAYSRMLDHLLRQQKISKLVVPSTFPALHFEALQKLKYKITVKPDPFFPERLSKSTDEKKAIRAAAIKVEKALHEAIVFLQKSKIKGKRIYHGKEVVTSELMQQLVNTRLMELGCVGENTIISSGVQASLPHHHGSGPIIPHTPIIFDIFPRDSHTMYYADMTRTFIKGKPSAMAKKMYDTVLEANKRGRNKVKAGVTGSEVHKTAADYITSQGFKTGSNKGRMEGFIHSTGHGLGLDVHEPPSVSPMGGPLQAGYVVTVEPGLYYKKWGGVRIEDDLFVTKTGSEVLTKFPYFFEID